MATPFYLNPDVLFSGAGVTAIMLIGTGVYAWVRRSRTNARQTVQRSADAVALGQLPVSQAPPATATRVEAVPPPAGRTLGALIRDQRLRRGLSRSQLAEMLDVADASVVAWETDVSRPALRLREALRTHVIDGEPAAVEDWHRFVELDDASLPEDPLALLRPLAQPGALSVEPSGAYQGLGRTGARQRTRLAIGTSAKVVVDLPWPGTATFLNVERLDVIPRSYVCLDPELGVAGPLAAGLRSLPARGGIPVEGPPALNCLLVMAWKRDRAFPWRSERAHASFEVASGDVLRAASELAQLGADDRFAAFCEYEVA